MRGVFSETLNKRTGWGSGESTATVMVISGDGLAGAFGLTRVMSSLLFRVSPTDPATFAGVPLIPATVARLARHIPAKRATRVDPIVVALRFESETLFATLRYFLPQNDRAWCLPHMTTEFSDFRLGKRISFKEKI